MFHRYVIDDSFDFFSFFRQEKTFLFEDDTLFPSNLNSKNYVLDENDIEVLLITIKKSKQILITTKCIFIIDKEKTIRINGDEIINFYFKYFDVMDEKFEESSCIYKKYMQYKVNRHVGDFRFTKIDGTFVDVYLSKRSIAYLLYDAIKRLQFVSRKYEGI